MKTEASFALIEEELANGKGPLTYRLLSRKLSVHVNTAKNLLSSFCAHKRALGESVYATYWLSGEPRRTSMNGDGNDMDVDDDARHDFSLCKIIIVGEEDLESSKTAFSKIHALHMYSVSSVSLLNASMFCMPLREVREMDRNGGDDLGRTVGKVISQQVKRGTKAEKSNKGSLKSQASTSFTAKPKPEVEPPRVEKALERQASHVKQDKAKTSGKLNWSKAKTKETVKEQPAPKTAVTTDESQKSIGTENPQKRGTKRKSDAVSVLRQHQDEGVPKEQNYTKSATNERGESTKTSTKTDGNDDASTTTRVKKGVILSDDEEEDQAATKNKSSSNRKARASGDSDTERSVRAMMDIDDADVIKASKLARSKPPEQDAEEEPPATDHVDSAMDEESDDPAPRVKPRKRKQKKAVPIGRNGLKKKRVVKSKTDFDEKGYMVTVDYSSYESVEEDEEEAVDTQKPQPKSRSRAVKKEPMTKEESGSVNADAEISGKSQGPSVPKGTASKKAPSKPKGRQQNGSQKSLASFFGSGGGKK